MKTHVAFILDRSSSMNAILQSTKAGTSDFIKKLRKDGGDVHFTLVAFDGSSRPTQFDLMREGRFLGNPLDGLAPHVCLEKWADDVPIADVKPQKIMQDYIGRGNTPMLDAIGHTVTQLEGKVGRGEKAIVVIMTDGQENSSTTWGYGTVKGLVKRLSRRKNWTFIFLGANIDAPMVAESMGMLRTNSMSYSSTAGSTRASMGAMGQSVSHLASGDWTASSHAFADAGIIDTDVREEEDKKKSPSAA